MEVELSTGARPLPDPYSCFVTVGSLALLYGGVLFVHDMVVTMTSGPVPNAFPWDHWSRALTLYGAGSFALGWLSHALVKVGRIRVSSGRAPWYRLLNGLRGKRVRPEAPSRPTVVPGGVPGHGKRSEEIWAFYNARDVEITRKLYDFYERENA